MNTISRQPVETKPCIESALSDLETAVAELHGAFSTLEDRLRSVTIPRPPDVIREPTDATEPLRPPMADQIIVATSTIRDTTESIRILLNRLGV